jgi:2'-5' RNA ligase
MRLFVAVMADGPTRDAVRDAQACLRPALERARLAWVAPAALHLTLRFLGDLDDATVAAVRGGLAAPLATPAFTVRWEGLGRFPQGGAPRVVWLGCSEGVEGWHALHREIATRLATAVAGDRDRFHPHLTIARVKAPGPRRLPWGEALSACAPPAVAVRVDRVTLVQSRLSPAGSTYTALSETPLA